MEETNEEYVIFRILTACIHCKQYYSPLGYCMLKGKPVEGLDSCEKFDCKYGKPVEEKKMKKNENEFVKETIKKNDEILLQLDDYDENGVPYWEKDQFQETEQMVIFLKALKTTFWFFFWSGCLLLGFIIGRNF